MKKKRDVKNEKNNGADTEMGYCPFEHKAGRASWGAGRRRAQGTTRGEQGRAGLGGARGAEARGAHAHGIGGTGARHSAQGRARGVATRPAERP